MGRTIHKITLTRENSAQKWGFGITGGNDVSLTFRVERVALASPAGAAGLKNLDYLIKVNDTQVFEEKCMLSHKELVQIIKNAPGDKLELEIERGEIKDNVTDVVPSFDLLIPKPKENTEPHDKNAYYRRYEAWLRKYGKPRNVYFCWKNETKNRKMQCSTWFVQ